MAAEALYIHIPFCRSKCAYCDFDSSALCHDRKEAKRAMECYMETLTGRIRSLGESGFMSSIKTAYIGGGTPSVLGALLPPVVSAVRDYCEPVEFSCEANPESLSEDLALSLKQAGVTRISLGVQSLNDKELRSVGRVHSAERALEAIALAKGLGFDVSGDLICGLPGQSAASWETSLQGLVSSKVDHISVYPLTLEEGTPLYKRALADEGLEPNEDFQASCMERAENVLGKAGFERYEVASYAKPGKACRHNLAYWSGTSYLGVGRSAAGMLSGKELSGMRGVYADAPEVLDDERVRMVQLDDGARSFSYEILSAREAAAEDLMLACRTTRGISPMLLRRAAQSIPLKNILESCEEACRLGLAEWRGDNMGKSISVGDSISRASLAPTKLGWLQGNVLFGLFWDLHESSGRI